MAPELESHIRKREFRDYMSKEGIIHIADIFTKGQIVIELQNSLISSKTIRDREEFYGDRMKWNIYSEPFVWNFADCKVDLTKNTPQEDLYYCEEFNASPGRFLDLYNTMFYSSSHLLVFLVTIFPVGVNKTSVRTQ